MGNINMDIETFCSRVRRYLLNIFSFLVFYSCALSLYNVFINSFQPRKDADGVLVFPFVKKRRSRNIQILTYHRVNNDNDPFFPAVPTEVFKEQMNYLASNFNVCSLEDAVELLKRNEVPENAVVITFDDGYRDVYVNAFPILKRLSIPATIFLSTNSIDSRRILWHDQVFASFRDTKESFLRGYGDDSKVYSLRKLEEKIFAQNEILMFLRILDDQTRSLWIDQLIEKLNVEKKIEIPDLMLKWDLVKEMHRSGISFGSHTVMHSILSRVSIDKAREEIYKSKEIIEDKLGVSVRTFSYPNGSKEDFNEDIKNILKDAGYMCAVTTIFGANDNGQDLLELRRGGPWEEYIPVFAAKLNAYKFMF